MPETPQRAHIFMPHLCGLLGRYCRSDDFDFVGTICLSIEWASSCSIRLQLSKMQSSNGLTL